MGEGEYLTAQEAAERLGYHVAHVRRLARDGTIRAERFGRTLMIPSSEVARIKALQGPGGRRPRSDSEDCT